MNHRYTFLILYQIAIRNVKQESQTTFPLSLLNMMIFRISLFLLLLDCRINNADSFEVFKHILSFIRPMPMPNSIYIIHNPLGVKYLTRLRIGFSYLKKHKFNITSIDPMCRCSSSSGVETAIHFFSPLRKF